MNKLIGWTLALLINQAQAVTHKDSALAQELNFLNKERYVFSAGKKKQLINETAAAIYVISQNDIRRSGALNIPEALRLVPGLQVAQIDANKWAISARGFNDRFSTKLLVLMDGRAVYTPTFSGVIWNREDTLLEDIERIEVIRGAGASVWGSNAVNGVINIITKRTQDTQGTLITAGGGNQESGFGSARYGGKLGDAFQYRGYTKGFKHANNVFADNQNAQDNWSNVQGGFKTQWQISPRNMLITQGDIYNSHTSDLQDFVSSSPPYVVSGQKSPTDYTGGNLQARFEHLNVDGSGAQLQLYYSQNDSNWQFLTPFLMHEKTFDLDFHQHFKGFSNHDIVWGLGYRFFNLTSTQTEKIAYQTTHISKQLFTGFIQDEMLFFDDTLRLTLGSRLEHNDFTGFEVQPTIRLLWAINSSQNVWASVSRAVRTPSLASDALANLTTNVGTVSGLPAYTSLSGNGDFDAESVLDYELGYRLQATDRLSFDVNAFYNDYSRLQAFQAMPPQFMGGTVEIPTRYTNKLTGETLGAEFTAKWQPQQAEWLKFEASYWFVKMNLQVPPQQIFVETKINEKATPQQQFLFKASLDLPFNIQVNPMLRYVDALPRFNIRHYTAVDLRLAWQADKNIEFSLVGQNLLDNKHAEFHEYVAELPLTEIQRSIFAKVRIDF